MLDGVVLHGHEMTLARCVMWGGHKMTFSSRIHLACQSHLAWMRDDIWKVYKGKFLQIFIIWPWNIGEVTSDTKFILHPSCMTKVSPPPHQSHHVRWTRDDFSNSHLMSISHDQVSPPPHQSYHVEWMRDDFSILISCDQVSPPPHQSYHVRWMRDDFLILISHPSHLTKCPLHHTKVIMWGGHEMTFRFSPHIHLVCPTSRCPLHPPKVTSHKHFSSFVTILILHPPHMPPPHENNIFNLV